MKFNPWKPATALSHGILIDRLHANYQIVPLLAGHLNQIGSLPIYPSSLSTALKLPEGKKNLEFSCLVAGLVDIGKLPCKTLNGKSL